MEFLTNMSSMLKQTNVQTIIFFVAAVIIVYSLIWIILKTPLVDLFTDRPGLRKVHQRIIPRVGGIAILVGFISFLQIWHFFLPSLPQLPYNLYCAFTFTAVAIMIVGLVDDMVVFEIHNRAKFILEVIIAAEVVFLNDIKLDQIHLLNWDFSLGWMGIPITIIWIVGVTNAINIIDGVDGLAGSVMAVIFATIAILTGFSGDIALLFLSIILVGLVCGFLMHNMSPARVFLGDTGSLFLGITIGTLSIYLVSRESSAYPLLIAPLVVGLPVLDVFVAMGRRFLKKVFAGVPWLHALGAMSIADNEHMHHRLIFRGLTHTETVLILVLFHAVICMSAIMIRFTNNTQNVVMLLYITILGAWFLYKLHFFDRLTKFISEHKKRSQSRLLTIAVIDCGDVLKCSLSKYNQDVFSFVFRSKDEIIEEPGRCTAAILEQNGQTIESVMILASSIFAQNSCPVIVIASQNESLPEALLDNALEQGLFLFLKKPVYIPILMKALDRLIQQCKGWAGDRVTEDTRQFYLQAVLHEEI